VKVEEFESLDLELLDEGPAGTLLKPSFLRRAVGTLSGATPTTYAARGVTRGAQLGGNVAGAGYAYNVIDKDTHDKDSDETVGDAAALAGVGTGMYLGNKLANKTARGFKKATQYAAGERALGDLWKPSSPTVATASPVSGTGPSKVAGSIGPGGAVKLDKAGQETFLAVQKAQVDLHAQNITKKEFAERVSQALQKGVTSAPIAQGAGLKGLLGRIFRKGGAHIALGAATGGIANALMWGNDLYAAVDYGSDVVSGKVAADQNATVHRGMAFEQIAKVFANGKSLEEQKKLIDRILSPEIISINQKTNPRVSADVPVHGARPTSIETPALSGTQTPMGFFGGKILNSIFNTKTKNPWDTGHDNNELLNVQYDKTGNVLAGPNTKKDFENVITKLSDKYEQLSTYDRIARGKERPAGFKEKFELTKNKLISAQTAIKSAPEVRRDAIANWAHSTLDEMHSAKLESVSTLMTGLQQAEPK
jgi:hypothetical protein